jgi:uncharacterized membrane protein
MATLTVWKFATADGAAGTIETLQRLQKQELIKIFDAATVSWPEGARKPKTQQLNNIVGAGALGGMFWGMLFGLIFFIPLLGAAIGAGFGALSGSLTDVGIDDDFIKSVRKEVEPGTSALFLMSGDAVVDKVKEALAGTFGGNKPQLIHTNLSNEQEAALRHAFAEE